MTTRSVITLVLALVIVALGGSAIYIFNKNKAAQNLANTTNNSSGVEGQGTVMIGIKDAAVDMGNITSVVVSVDKAEIQHQTQGWITISSTPADYDLLALKKAGATALLAQTNVSAGTYNQLRLMISKVMVTENGSQKEAKLPSGEIKIIGILVVDANKTSTAVFDIIADKSLHKTGNGKFIFAPVVKLETQSSTDASVDSANQLKATTGRVDSNISAGMNVDGEMKTDFMLNSDITLSEVGNVIKIGIGDEKDKTIKIDAQGAIDVAINNKYLDSATSVAFVMERGKKAWVVSGLKNLMVTSVYIDAMTGAMVSN